MSRLHAQPTAVCPAHTLFRRKLTLIWAIGTLLPMGVLAMLYLLAPLPMTAGTAEVLHTANRIAGIVVLVHWAITLAVWMGSRFVARTPAPARNAGWQDIKLADRAAA